MKTTPDKPLKISASESPVPQDTVNDTPSAESPSVETLRLMLEEATRKENELVMSKLNTLEKEHNVGIGIRLDANRLSDILLFMFNNNKPSITLKCEVWKNPGVGE